MEKIDLQRCCDNCQFYVEIRGKGECRRFPPQVCANPHSEVYDSHTFNFPQVKKDDWCGEFETGEVGWILPKGFHIKHMPDGPGALCEMQD